MTSDETLGHATESAAASRRGMRLDAYLSRAGLATRKEARGLIRKGFVRVDGEVCRDAARRVLAEVVVLGEEMIDSPAARCDWLLHKPVGVSCSRDGRESPLVYDLLPDRLRRRPLQMAGRLDRATSGLLVLTTDGDLVHALTHPTRKVTKRYRIAFEGELVAEAVERCAEGWILPGRDDRPIKPSMLSLDDSSRASDGLGRATLVLREGRTHQVRRMIRDLGGEVVTLHRDRMGALDLPADLEPGAFRPLADGDLRLLLSDKSL